MAVLSNVWRTYLGFLQKRPLLTMSGTTGVLAGAGDVISQTFVENQTKKYDPKRSLRFFVFGCVAVGPILRGWYFTLDKLFVGSKMAPIKMLLADQLLFAPNMLWFFLTGMGVLRGESFGDIKTQLKNDYASVLVNNYKLWPAAQLVNFYLIPLQHRVLFVNFIALGWNTYIAWLSEGKQ